MEREMNDWFLEAEFYEYLKFSRQGIILGGYDSYAMYCMGEEL